MSKKAKYIVCQHAPHEIPCRGLYIEFDPSIMEKVLSKDPSDIKAVNEYLAKIMNPTKEREQVLGVHTEPEGATVLVAISEDGSHEEILKSLQAEYEKLGCSAKIIEGIGFADGRYLVGRCKNFLSPLPPQIIEKEIVRIMETYCHEWNVSEDPSMKLVFYEGDLGGRKLTIGVQDGIGMISGGINGLNMHTTREVKKHWRDVLRGLERDIVQWSAEHPSLAKRPAGNA